MTGFCACITKNSFFDSTKENLVKWCLKSIIIIVIIIITCYSWVRELSNVKILKHCLPWLIEDKNIL